MSAGILFFLFGVIADTYMVYLGITRSLMNIFAFGFYLILAGSGFFMMYWAAGKWYHNQKYFDRKIKADAIRSELIIKAEIMKKENEEERVKSKLERFIDGDEITTIEDYEG